jgi:hypothetical protein
VDAGSKAVPTESLLTEEQKKVSVVLCCVVSWSSVSGGRLIAVATYTCYVRCSAVPHPGLALLSSLLSSHNTT